MITEILSEQEFKHFRAIRDGYIVITDSIRNTIHYPSCDNVDIVNFREKVLQNSRTTGHYYFTDDLVEGREFYSAEKCLNCRPK